jgi:hypothetical protein
VSEIDEEYVRTIVESVAKDLIQKILAPATCTPHRPDPFYKVVEAYPSGERRSKSKAICAECGILYKVSDPR